MSTIECTDGRLLDVEVSGPADGVPLVHHHGTPGSKRPFRSLQRAAARRGLRLVTYSRPGYGESSRLANRRVVDVASDSATILDHLSADRCLVSGWSGGGPHALAMAAKLPDRVAGVLCTGGVGPYGAPGLEFLEGMGEQNLIEFDLALDGEDRLRPALEPEASGLRTATGRDLVAAFSTLLPEADRAVLTDEYGEDLAATFSEAVRAGVDGWVDDDLAFVRPWGFDLADVRAPTFLWQGTEDLMVPLNHGRWLAERLPRATAHLEPGEGHLSIGLTFVDRMLDELVGTL